MVVEVLVAIFRHLCLLQRTVILLGTPLSHKTRTACWCCVGLIIKGPQLLEIQSQLFLTKLRLWVSDYN